MIYQQSARANQDPKKEDIDLRFVDLDLKNNPALQSEAHMGDRRLWSAEQEDPLSYHLPPALQMNNCYDLRGIVIHYGTGMTFGHYWALARSNGAHNQKWVEYDDGKARVIDDREVNLYYG